jgi:hypothetical protein
MSLTVPCWLVSTATPLQRRVSNNVSSVFVVINMLSSIPCCVRAYPSLVCAAFVTTTLSTQRKNVSCGVNVTVMDRAATTSPLSYSNLCDTFRAAAYTARRTQLGSPSFVNLDITRSVPAGLIAEHVTEHRPASVIHGLCHPRLTKLGRVHIADDDQFVLASNLGARLMQMVLSRIDDFSVNSLGAAFVAGALRYRKPVFISAVMPQCRHRQTVAACCKCLEAKIDANPSVPGSPIINLVHMEADIPAPKGVFDKAAAFGVIWQRPALIAKPAIALAKICDRIAVDLATFLLEWYPPQ